MRELLAPPSVGADHLIWPVFVQPGSGRPVPLASMPGLVRYPVASIERLGPELVRDGVRAVLLFGIPRRKDAAGTEASAAASAVAQATRALRRRAPELVVFTDVCLCAYTDTGHCAIARGRRWDEGATLRRLGEIAVAHARAGAEFVGPSAAMDHQVAAVRAALDDAGFSEVGILAYSAKFASAFYGPFREAEESTPAFGDRKGYQFDVRMAREAVAAFVRDQEEGADILMAKPAMSSLDILALAKLRVDRPLAAYQVSGEYSMIRAAAERGWVDARGARDESLSAIRRAGADLIVSYFAREIAREGHVSR